MFVFVWRLAPNDWPVEYVSDNVKQVLGYTADDFISGRASWLGITYPEDIPRLETEVARYMANGERKWSQEYRLITRSGEIRWFSDQNLALADSQGNITHIQSIIIGSGSACSPSASAWALAAWVALSVSIGITTS